MRSAKVRMSRSSLEVVRILKVTSVPSWLTTVTSIMSLGAWAVSVLTAAFSMFLCVS